MFLLNWTMVLVWELLTLDNDGSLSLDEIVLFKPVPGMEHPINGSPLMMYRVCGFGEFVYK